MTSQNSDQSSLKQAVVDLTTEHNLPKEKLDQLSKLQLAVLNEDKKLSPGKWLHNRGLYAMAASVACTLCLIIFFYLQQGALTTSHIQTIAEEVANQHIKLKPLDIETSSILEAKKFFTQLDFSPKTSHFFSNMDGSNRINLIGGRYCSIKGVTAAQLRYLSEKGINTLYEAVYDPDIFGDIPDIDKNQTAITKILKGLKVTLWVEKGLLMVLVSETEE